MSKRAADLGRQVAAADQVTQHVADGDRLDVRVVDPLRVIMTGSRSVRSRSISNDADPLPMITAACSAAVGTPQASRMSPTSARQRRCGGQLPGPRR